MSAELVRKGFELDELELGGGSSGKGKRKKAKSWQSNQDGLDEGFLPQKRLKTIQKKKKNAGPQKSLLEQYIEQSSVDYTASNIKHLKKLTKLRRVEDSSEHREQILQHIHRKHFDRQKKEEKKEETSVFTDRDFEKFEEEYDFFKNF